MLNVAVTASSPGFSTSPDRASLFPRARADASGRRLAHSSHRLPISLPYHPIFRACKCCNRTMLSC